MNHQVDENQIKFYRENGFIVLEDFLSPDELEHWRETVMNAVRKRLGQKITGKAAFDRVSAIMAVKSTDGDEHWVLIWGTEIDTYKNGKVDSTDLQETWRFNDAGKANLLFQYKRPAAPAKVSK